LIRRKIFSIISQFGLVAGWGYLRCVCVKIPLRGKMETMKKVIYRQYGGVDVLEMVEEAIPEPDAASVLVRVKAVSINPIDWKIRAGEMKVMSGSKFPKGVGIDFSGVVEAVGGAVNKFKKGDAVFGSVDQFKGGALAEYVVVGEAAIGIKPGGVSFEKAAAMPVVGFAALQIFDRFVPVQEGTEVLINGASGGIGMFAVQIAKKRGATVTAVVGESGVALAEKWGSDRVLDYRRTNVLGENRRYDAVIDLSDKLPFKQAKAIMKRSSVYVNTVPGPKQIIGSFLHNLLSKKKYRVLLSKPFPAYLDTLARNVGAGMDVVVGRVYAADRFKDAYTEMPKGGVVGKAVFTF
jgi:NADPH:quinone reductase-like Zn-dependent oxidoreductase